METVKLRSVTRVAAVEVVRRDAFKVVFGLADALDLGGEGQQGVSDDWAVWGLSL